MFRDGPREVPDHVGELMRGVETIQLTYDQAVAAANHSLANRHLKAEQDRLLTDHFRKWGRS
jgi:hypothetical protein